MKKITATATTAIVVAAIITFLSVAWGTSQLEWGPRNNEGEKFQQVSVLRTQNSPSLRVFRTESFDMAVNASSQKKGSAFETRVFGKKVIVTSYRARVAEGSLGYVFGRYYRCTSQKTIPWHQENLLRAALNTTGWHLIAINGGVAHVSTWVKAEGR